MDNDLTAYRDSISKSRDEAQDSHDKAIMSAAGGGLAVALGFVRMGSPPALPWLLPAACGLLTLSLIAVIASFRRSVKAFDHTLAQVDSPDGRRIYSEPAGGRYSRETRWWNAVAYYALILGIIALGAFVTLNLEKLARNVP